MGIERRQHSRIARPLEAEWSASSGLQRGRLTDISLSGCFFETTIPASPGERTVITVRFSDTDVLALPGEVVYQEPRLGFAVRFTDLSNEQADRLSRGLERLQSRSA